jgi:CRP-like cAMP-binding protein
MADNDQDMPPPPPPRPRQPWVSDQSDYSPHMPSNRRNAALYETPFVAGPAPETVELTGSSTIRLNATATATVTVDAEVVRAPFSEFLIAERLAADPEFYRRLATHVASELRAYASSVDTQGQANASHVIKGRVTEVADGFDEAASTLAPQDGILTPAAAQKAAAVVSKIREAYAALCSDHPELLQIAAVGLAGYALHQIGGVSADLAALISYAVVKKEKLTDIFAIWKGKGGEKK